MDSDTRTPLACDAEKPNIGQAHPQVACFKTQFGLDCHGTTRVAYRNNPALC